MNRYDAETLMRDEMRKHGLRGWSFEWMRAKHTFGLCQHHKKTLKLSGVFVDCNDEATVLLVIRHEIAHALMGPGFGHGKEWRALCIKIGGDGKTCSDAEVSVTYAWQGKCGGCGKVTNQHRAPLVVRACSPCFSRHGIAKATIIWRKNGARMRLGEMPVRYVQQVLTLRKRYADFPI